MTKWLLPLFLLIPLSSHAATITLAWDPNPPEEQVTQYCVFEDDIKKWCGPETQTTLTTIPGRHKYTATAHNVWGISSDHSDPLYTAAAATAPKGLKINVQITVEVN